MIEKLRVTGAVVAAAASVADVSRRFGHAARRTPMHTPGKTGADHTRAKPRTPAPDQVDLAEKVLATIPQALPCARVDLVRLPDGSPVAVELAEPSGINRKCRRQPE